MRHDSRDLEIVVSRAFAGGLSVRSSLSAHIRCYAAVDPLFLKARRDWQTRLSTNLLHRAAGPRVYSLSRSVTRVEPFQHPDQHVSQS